MVKAVGGKMDMAGYGGGWARKAKKE